MPTAHRFERTDRVAQLVRSVVASEMERLDEAFDGVVITAVDIDRELSVAVVHYDVRDDDAAEAAAAAFDELGHRLQRAVGVGTSLKRTPVLRFRRDQGAIAAGRIEELLAGLADHRPVVPLPPSDTAVDDSTADQDRRR
ncbi:ribosome-binding factor A [Candidatus Poriferisodalis sp.]|uniref:ribosome-binding factor A n=1 Tax=Candidatus Poriferisodalis sp. TaxID=3101277 RepID=UPI003B01C83E